MSGTNIVTLITTLCTVLAVVVAAMAYFAGQRSERRRDKTDARDRETAEQTAAITAAVAAALAPVNSRLERLSDKLDSVADVQQGMNERVQVMDRDMTETRTKVQLFWDALGKDAARILHQPHPERQHIDKLLDRYMAGALKSEERIELAAYLRYIINWHHEDIPDFPIFPGDQVAAAILLRKLEMDHDSEESGNARPPKGR